MKIEFFHEDFEEVFYPNKNTNKKADRVIILKNGETVNCFTVKDGNGYIIAYGNTDNSITNHCAVASNKDRAIEMFSDTCNSLLGYTENELTELDAIDMTNIKMREMIKPFSFVVDNFEVFHKALVEDYTKGYDLSGESIYQIAERHNIERVFDDESES